MAMPLLLLGLASTAAEQKCRIAYVTNAWFPKVDGAAITIMGHAHYFAQAGHPVRARHGARPTAPLDVHTRHLHRSRR